MSSELTELWGAQGDAQQRAILLLIRLVVSWLCHRYSSHGSSTIRGTTFVPSSHPCFLLIVARFDRAHGSSTLSPKFGLESMTCQSLFHTRLKTSYQDSYKWSVDGFFMSLSCLTANVVSITDSLPSTSASPHPFPSILQTRSPHSRSQGIRVHASG